MKCEQDIHDYEEDLKSVEKDFLNPENQCNVAKLQELQKRKEADEQKLTVLYDEWEELASEGEE